MRLFIFISLIVGLFFSCVSIASIDLNTATEQELSQELKNIGKDKAAAIVEYRKMHGNFSSIDDLKKIKGIGEATVEMNRHKMSIPKGKMGVQQQQKQKGS